MRKPLLLLLVLALAAAACGGDDAADDKEAAVQALQRQITESQADDASDMDFSDAETLCMAEGMVDEFGVARIIDASDQEFEVFMGAATQEERRAVVDLTLECVDMSALIAGPLMAEGLSEDSATCIGDAMIGNDAFRDVVAGGLATGSFDPTASNEEALMTALLPVMLECLSAEELANLGG